MANDKEGDAFRRRFVLESLAHACARFSHHPKEAEAFVQVIHRHQEQLGLQLGATPGDPNENAVQHRQQDGDLSPIVELRQLGDSLRHELARVQGARTDHVRRRLRHLAKATELTPTDVRVLEFLLRAQVDDLLQSMIDDLDEHHAWRGRSFRLRHSMLPSLLGLPANSVWARFAPEAPLVRTGLVAVDNDGDVTLLDRLTRLDWVSRSHADSDVVGLLLEEASPADVGWDEFDHLADARDAVERILRGALGERALGVNILLYGPPGSGKTSLCRTLAARLGVRLYVVGEQDANGHEPTRHERLQDLRLAQRLLAGNNRSLIRFPRLARWMPSGAGQVLWMHLTTSKSPVSTSRRKCAVPQHPGW